jgi:hypothetical protein
MCTKTIIPIPLYPDAHWWAEDTAAASADPTRPCRAGVRASRCTAQRYVPVALKSRRSLTSLTSLTSLLPLSPPGPARPPADMPLGLKKTSSLSVMVRPGLRRGWVPSALHGTMATLHYAGALRLGPARKTTATRNRKRESRQCTRPTQGAPAASSPALASHMQPPALAAPCHILEPGSNVHGCLPAACTCSPLHLHTLLLSSSLNAQLRNLLCFIKSLLDASPGT